MAVNLQSLEEDFTCPICVELLREPVLLSCQHSFCRECLEVYATHSQKNNDISYPASERHMVSCPVCRSCVFLDGKEIDELCVQFNLLSIVDKHRNQSKNDEDMPKCSVCEHEEKKLAVTFCMTCSIFYCKDCVTVIHPMRGALTGHNLMTVEEYICYQEARERTGTKDDVIDTSLSCDDHGGELLLFCGSCERPLCKDCVRGHSGHSMLDIQAIYDKDMELLEEKTKNWKQLNDKVHEMLEELSKFQADVEGKKSLHNLEIEKAYKEAIETVNEWRRDSLETIGKKYQEWLDPCLEATRHLERKTREIKTLLQSSNQLLRGRTKSYFQDRTVIKRIDEMTRATEVDLQQQINKKRGWRYNMDGDVVLARRLFIKDRQISTPDFKFFTRVGRLADITENGAVLVNVDNGEWTGFNGALAYDIPQPGCCYWELDLSFDEKKRLRRSDLLYSAGVVRHRSDFGQYVGDGELTWGVVIYGGGDYISVHMHGGEVVSDRVSMYPETGTVRQGFYLDHKDRTLTILDITDNRVLHTFTDLDLSKPLRPAVSVHS